MGNQAGVDVQICHLLYADDTMIFCEAKEEQVCFIRIILIVLEEVSRLSVNWRKSSMFQVKDVSNIQCLANILSCKIEKLPTTYLGMPLGNTHKELEIWDGVVEKTKKISHLEDTISFLRRKNYIDQCSPGCPINLCYVPFSPTC